MRASWKSNSGSCDRRLGIVEKKTSLSLLQQFLRQRNLDPDKLSLTTITRPLLLEFVEDYSNRKGKNDGQSLSARTVLKLLGHLREFFDFAIARNWIANTPLDSAFEHSLRGLKARASQLKGRRNYKPFSGEDLRHIFEPHSYLRFNSAADDFWVPLMGLFTGARLGELVKLQSRDIHHDSHAGVWVMSLSGKNDNSTRQVPVPQVLIEMGFLNYVFGTRRQLDQPLFPHRAMNPTREADPSKHASRAFGEYLDRIGIDDPLKVFHSLRHTVISRMHVCGVPVGDAELIVGHAAQDNAIRSDLARSHSGRSGVHLDTYAHPDVYTLRGEPVLARLKRRLDESLDFQLDLLAFRKAAAIVLDHTRAVRQRKPGIGSVDVWVSGWHTNAKHKADVQVAKLDESWDQPAAISDAQLLKEKTSAPGKP